MNLQDQLLLDTPDERLNSFARDRKKQLQQQIAGRAKLKAPLLAANPNDKPGPKQPQSLADDQQHCFDKHTKIVRQARAASNTQDAREEKRAAQRAEWQQKNTPTTSGGTPTTPELQKLKQASDASRLAPKRPAFTLTQDALDTLLLCVEGVMRKHPDYFISTFNGASLNNCIQTKLGRGWEAGQTLESLICPRLVEESYAECLRGNHFELAYTRDPVTGGRVSKRGEKLFPPTEYPKYIWPDEAQLLAQAEQAEALRLNSAEAQHAIQLSFDELQAKVHANYKRGGNEDVR